MLIWAVLTVIVGYAGPFGTYLVLSVVPRMVFWAVIMAAAILCGTGVRAFVHGALGLRSFAVGSVLIAAILALVLPPIVHLVLLVWVTNPAVTSPGIFEIAVFVFLTSLGVGAYRHATGLIPQTGRPLAMTAPDAAPLAVLAPVRVASTALSHLVRRLPADVQGPLISIAVRDHYVDVTTRQGQASLLLRLSDAVREVSPDEGTRVHRSHWVAWDAIEAVEIRDAKMMLRLWGGRHVPVSRTYKTALEERGIGITRAV